MGSRRLARKGLFSYAMAMSGETLTLPSFAKINLRLEVIGKRSDGFHDLCTIFQTVSLRDTITFAALNEGDVLTCSDPAVPTAEGPKFQQHDFPFEFRKCKGVRVEPG